MKDVENKNQIVDIDGYVHVVNGKVICFEPDVLDLNKSEDVEHLVTLLQEMFVSLMYPAIYGEKDTMVYLDNHPDGDSKIVSMGCIEDLPDELKGNVRLEVLKYNNQIVDIDGYVHVVNGKVICFEPDVYDLNNIEDVAYLCQWVDKIRADDYDSRLYNDDIKIVLRNHPDGNSHIVTTGLISLLPDDIRKEVRRLQSEYQSAAGNLLFKGNG